MGKTEMWTAKEGYWKAGMIEVFEYKNIPVLVAKTGTYPIAECADGRTTESVPHLLISVGGGVEANKETWAHVCLLANGEYRHSRRRCLTVFQHHAKTELDDPDSLIEEAKKHLDEGVDVLKNLNALFDEAENRLHAVVQKYQKRMSRPEYEAACREQGVEALSDEDCDSYGVKYGHCWYPEYSVTECITHILAQRRLAQIEAEKRAMSGWREDEPTANPPQPKGQLWEPCERCGREPVYMPLHLCTDCWPR